MSNFRYKKGSARTQPYHSIDPSRITQVGRGTVSKLNALLSSILHVCTRCIHTHTHTHKHTHTHVRTHTHSHTKTHNFITGTIHPEQRRLAGTDGGGRLVHLPLPQRQRQGWIWWGAFWITHRVQQPEKVCFCLCLEGGAVCAEVPCDSMCVRVFNVILKWGFDAERFGSRSVLKWMRSAFSCRGELRHKKIVIYNGIILTWVLFPGDWPTLLKVLRGGAG